MSKKIGKRFLTPVAPPALSSDPIGVLPGSIYYNTTINSLKVFNGTVWQSLTPQTSNQASSIEALDTAPSNPFQGSVYFDKQENTIKAYNGNIWYDLAGPKELIDHVHYTDGYVQLADYGNYVEFGNYIVNMDGGTASTSYASAPNNDIIDGGSA